MNMKPTSLIIFLIVLFTIFACEKDPTSSKDDETITDIDENVYKTVTIGDQVWLAENLKVTHFRNGDAIPNVTDSAEWSDVNTGAYCNYNNDTAIANIYGKLYNLYAINDDRGLAPEGWHIPTDEAWTTLTDYLGGNGIAGGKLKETGFEHWNSPNIGASNESGFTALPGGQRDGDWNFNGLNSTALFCTKPLGTNLESNPRYVDRYSSGITRTQWSGYGSFEHGLSVRCVKD